MTGDLKIKVRGLCKSFGRKVVLKDLDLDVPKGQSLVVIGGSGTGKSVLIKCIIGLLQPDKGSIEIDGHEVTRMSSGEREEIMHKFGMLFQGGALFDSLPVWENVAFGLIAGQGFNRAEAKEIALRKLAAVGLGPEPVHGGAVGPHHLLAVDPDRADVGLEQAQDALDQHRLAGARAADDDERPAGRHVEVDALQDPLRPEALGEPADHDLGGVGAKVVGHGSQDPPSG